MIRRAGPCAGPESNFEQSSRGGGTITERTVASNGEGVRVAPRLGQKFAGSQEQAKWRTGSRDSGR